MKQLLLSVIFCSLAAVASAQNAKQDAAGNFVEVPRVQKPGKTTGRTIKDLKGETHEVFQTATGKFYYNKTSKAGKEYRAYIKTEGR